MNNITSFSVFTRKPLIAGILSSWKYIISPLSDSIEPGDKVKIGYDLRGGIDYNDCPQNENPSAKNFFTFSAPKNVKIQAKGYFCHHSGKYGKLEERVENETYFWRDQMKGLTSLNLHILELEILKGRLEPEDTITVKLGDTKKGSAGITTPCQATDFWRHWAFIHRKNGKLEFLGEDFLTVKAGKSARALTVVPSVLALGESFKAKTAIMDINGNPVGNIKYKYSYDKKRYKPGQLLNIKQQGVHRIQTESARKISNFSNPAWVTDKKEFNLYWGDIHGHSIMSDGGTRTPTEYYAWAKDVMKLDFAALTDHDFGIALYDPSKNWAVITEAAKRFNDDGTFVTLPAWEMSHLGLLNNDLKGHKNIYFMTDNPPFYNSSPYGKNRVKLDYIEIEKLIKKLERKKIKFMLIDHTSHCLTRWDRFDDRYQRAVEVHSFFGSTEWIDIPNTVVASAKKLSKEIASRAALEKGYKIGFIAGTDTHMGSPANLKESSTSFAMSGSDILPGMAAVWAKELTREAIFNAIWNRRTYAVRGSRILLDFSVNGHMMGQEFKIDSPLKPRQIQILTAGTAPIKKIELIHNNRIIKKWDAVKKMDKQLQFNHRSELKGLSANKKLNYYYVRVLQENGHMAWSSPIWINC